MNKFGLKLLDMSPYDWWAQMKLPASSYLPPTNTVWHVAGSYCRREQSPPTMQNLPYLHFYKFEINFRIWNKKINLN